MQNTRTYSDGTKVFEEEDGVMTFREEIAECLCPGNKIYIKHTRPDDHRKFLEITVPTQTWKQSTSNPRDTFYFRNTWTVDLLGSGGWQPLAEISQAKTKGIESIKPEVPGYSFHTEDGQGHEDKSFEEVWHNWHLAPWEFGQGLKGYRCESIHPGKFVPDSEQEDPSKGESGVLDITFRLSIPCAADEDVSCLS